MTSHLNLNCSMIVIYNPKSNTTNKFLVIISIELQIINK